MDGYSRDSRTSAPVGLMGVLRARESTELALRVWADQALLVPVEVPSLPVLSDALAQLLDAKQPSTVPDELRREHDAYCAARLERINAKGENVRRLRSVLWCEAELRKHKRPEHVAVRLFSRDVWGMTEPASDDYSVREQQVRAHA